MSGCLLPSTAGPLAIQNQSLIVRFDERTDVFSLTERSSGVTFVDHGKLQGMAGAARVEIATDPVFGRGRRLVVPQTHGGTASLELYRGLPFVVIRGEWTNKQATPVDITREIPATFNINLGVPISQLRTLGTAGLTSIDQNPGSYLFLTLADPATRRGVVAGWLTAERGSGVLLSENQNGTARFRAQLDYGHLRLDPGETSKLETLLIGVFDDARVGQELYADALARQHRIHLRPPMAGYCTWYSDLHGGAADEKSILELAEFAARELKPFGLSFIQIDDKWQDGKERNGPARRFTRVKPDGPYSHGMKPVADRFRQMGLTAGLWFLPFASDWQDPEFKDRQDWFVKRAEGGPFETPWGNTSLDLTRPLVQEYLRQMVRTIHGWGYDYFKMDGLWTGSAAEQIYVNDGYRDDHFGGNAPFFDPRKTNLEVYRNGLKLLREAASSQVFFSGCNVSQNMRTLGGSIGLVDSMRIGPDNGQQWRDYREEIVRNESGSLITGPVRGSRLYFLNGRVWWNDPDPTYVRGSVPLAQAQLITSWVGLSGQFYLNSDWLPRLPPERLNIIKRTIPPHAATARPVDYFDTIMPRIWMLTDIRKEARRDVLGLYNWDSEEQRISCTAKKAGLDPSRSYFAFDFWANTPAQSFCGEFDYQVPARSCRIIALRAAAGHPVLVSTSRHISQGILEVKEEKWSASNKTLSGISDIVGGDPYELRLAGLEDSQKVWKLASARAVSMNGSAGVTVAQETTAPSEPGWLRIVIHSETSGLVKWELKFAPGPTIR